MPCWDMKNRPMDDILSRLNTVLRNCKKHNAPRHQAPTIKKLDLHMSLLCFFLTKHWKHIQSRKHPNTPHPWVWSRSGSCFSKLVLKNQGELGIQQTFKSIEPKTCVELGKLWKVMWYEGEENYSKGEKSKLSNTVMWDEDSRPNSVHTFGQNPAAAGLEW